MDRGDRKAFAVLVDDNFRFAVHLLWLEVRHAEQSDERHGKTGGVSRPKQLLRIGARLLAVAAEEGAGIGFQRAALRRDRALAFTQTAVPGRRSESFHGSYSFRVVHVPQLAGVSALAGSNRSVVAALCWG